MTTMSKRGAAGVRQAIRVLMQKEQQQIGSHIADEGLQQN